ncbi:MAG: DNA-binding protein [Candidatus Electrothrix sp. LOE2]|nr:DNA-binding protein [Candidatus Electrothrix sp. LOE2]
MKPKVYIETSVVSYLTARPSRDLIVAANQQSTNEWWKERKGSFDVFISSLVEEEAGGGDPDAAKKRLKALRGIPLLTLSQEALIFSKQLLAEGSLPQKAAEDAMHIAIATLNGMDYLLTWNFKHIANASVRWKIERICRESGFEPAVICTPQESMED